MGMTEHEMVGWDHQFNGHEFEQALGDCERQGSLACGSLWGCKESDMTEQLSKNMKVLCGFKKARKYSGGDRAPDLPLEKPVCRSGGNS